MKFQTFVMRLHGYISWGGKSGWMMKDDISRWDPLSIAKESNYSRVESRFLVFLEPAMKLQTFLCGFMAAFHVEEKVAGWWKMIHQGGILSPLLKCLTTTGYNRTEPLFGIFGTGNVTFVMRLHGCISWGEKSRWIIKDGISRWDPLFTTKVSNYRLMTESRFCNISELIGASAPV